MSNFPDNFDGALADRLMGCPESDIAAAAQQAADEQAAKVQARSVAVWNANLGLLIATLTDDAFPAGSPFHGFDVDAARAHLGELKAMLPAALEAAQRADAAGRAEWLAAYNLRVVAG